MEKGETILRSIKIGHTSRHGASSAPSMLYYSVDTRITHVTRAHFSDFQLTRIQTRMLTLTPSFNISGESR